MYSYASYYQLRTYGVEASYPTSIANLTSTELTEQTPQMNIARAVTRAIDSFRIQGNNPIIIEDTFMPLSETRYYDAVGYHIDNLYKTLDLDRSICTLTSVTLADSTSLTVNTDVRLHPRGRTGVTQLQLTTNTNSTWNDYTTDWRQGIAINGIWCYRSDYTNNGWIDSDDAIADATGITAAATSITVTSASGADINGFAPRFDIGNLIRCDSEYMVITAVNYTTKVLTVLRGQRGTTAATHANGTQIDKFIVEPEIMQACAMAANFEYARRGAYEKVTIAGGGTTAIVQPTLWPERVIALLMRFAKVRVSSV